MENYNHKAYSAVLIWQWLACHLVSMLCMFIFFSYFTFFGQNDSEVS